MNYELISVSHLLEGNLVEAGIDVVRGTCLSFAMRHDESHFRDAFVLAVLTSDADVGEGNKPTVRHVGTAILRVHCSSAVYFRVEVGRETPIVVGYFDDVGTWMPVVDIVAELNAVAQNVELDEATYHASCLALLELFASAFAYNLHIDARVAEEDVLVLAQVGRGVLFQELLLVDGVYLTNVADDVAVSITHHDISAEERLDGFVFLVLLLSVSLAVLARENGQQTTDNRQQI